MVPRSWLRDPPWCAVRAPGPAAPPSRPVTLTVLRASAPPLSVLRHLIPAGALPAVEGNVVGREIVLGYDDRRLRNLLRNRLVPQIVEGDHCADTSLNEAVVVAAGEHLSRLYRVDRFLGAVDSRNQRLTVGLGERVHRTDGHRVICGEDAC